ncbi:MAG TPA: hypothetical protein VGC87_12130 [Pyrinomonadaceae bacterium]|jgi:hypothetical protein
MLEEQNRLTLGNWGGKHVILEVTAAGARLQFDCASGSIGRPVTLDGEGRFDLRGTFARSAFGPRREDDPQQAEPARYSGTVKDRSMTLKVTLTQTDEEIGTFTLTLGKPGRIWRCN